MSRLPQRQSLPAQTADIIIEMIASAELADTLPGERSLAARLQIGRDTLRSALEILETQGYISARKHGVKRAIIKSPKITSRPITKRVAFLSPKKIHELPPWMLVEVDTLRELLHSRGYHFELITPGIFHLKNPARQLDKLAESNQFDVWILYQCPILIQKWFQDKELPTIIRGYPNKDITTPYIDVDWKATAYHAGTVLARNGHQHVGLLMPNIKLAGLAAAEKGLREAIESETHRGQVSTLIDKIETSSVCAALEQTFLQKSPPTAIVGTRTRHTLSVLSWLAEHGLSIPKNLSYISLAYEPWFEHLVSPITHYHADPASFARSLVQKIVALADGKSKTQPIKLIIPEFHKGHSVRPR